MIRMAQEKVHVNFANEYLISTTRHEPKIPQLTYWKHLDSMTYFGKDVKGWVHDPTVFRRGAGRLTLTVSDIAKFGQLYLNEGIHNGKQIRFKIMDKRITEMNQNQYGYFIVRFEKKMEYFSMCYGWRLGIWFVVFQRRIWCSNVLLWSYAECTG